MESVDIYLAGQVILDRALVLIVLDCLEELSPLLFRDHNRLVPSGILLDSTSSQLSTASPTPCRSHGWAYRAAGSANVCP